MRYVQCTCVRNAKYFEFYTAVIFPFQNTFQVILISDGTYSYAIFTYKCGLMDWGNGVTIGFNAGDDPYANADPSSKEIACVNSPDSDWNNVVYVISNDNPEDPPPGENYNSFLVLSTETCHVQVVLYFYPNTGNVEVTNITYMSAIVGWSVASISSQQQYYVVYGEEQNALNNRSDTITVSNVALTNQNYSVTLTGLSSRVRYYIRVKAGIADTVLSTDITSFRTLESGNAHHMEYHADSKSIIIHTQYILFLSSTIWSTT